MKPYPYQRTCLNALGAARRKGRKRALAVMATGLGKTVVSAFEIKRLLKEAPGRVLYLCHSNHILRQARKTFEEVLGDSYTHGYFHGTEKHLHHVDVLYGSFQTMYKQRKKFKRREFRYVVVDEVHHAHAATFRPTIEYFQPDWMIGLTATPERGDGLDISTLFEGPPVFELGIFKALARRHLCDVDYRIMTDEIQKLEVLDTPVGKLSIAELNRTVFVPKRDKEIARIVRQKAAEEFENPRVMVFCASIEHAERMAKLMPHAAVVHSKLKPKEKDERLDAFRSGKISTILTVDMLNEGIDVPEANVIVFLRSTASRRIFLQQLGRGLRKALGKLKVLVLDFVANCERLEMIDQLQQGVGEALNALPSGPKADSEASETQPAFILTLDGGEFDERVWQIFDVISEIRHTLPYSREMLISQLLQLSNELCRTPREADVNRSSQSGVCASSTTFKEVFGSFNKALEAAGLTRNHHRGQSDEELLDQLRTLAKQLARVPYGEDVDSSPLTAHSTTFVKRFGSFPRSLELAGLKDPDPNEALLVQHLLGLAVELGHAPRFVDVEVAYKSGKGYSGHVYIKVFGSFNDALTRSGLTVRLQKGVSDRAMLGGLRRLTKELGHTPSGSEWNEHCKRLKMPGRSTLINRFGSFNQALILAKLEPTHRKGVTREEVLPPLKRLIAKLGRAPTQAEMRREGLADPVTLEKLFGSFEKALSEAGVSIKKGSRKNIPPAELEEHLRRLAKALGRCPVASDLPDDGPSKQPYYRVYGSWPEALKAAGIK